VTYRPHTSQVFHWTALPCLPLLDTGTAQVESLESYVVRISATTGESVKGFLSTLDRSIGRKDAGSGQLPGLLVGPGNRFVRRLKGLVSATGVEDLHKGTLLSLNCVLRERAGLGISTHRRWCPPCLEAGRAVGKTQQLIWVFDQLSRCGLHGCLIEDSCRTCSASLPTSTPLRQSLLCPHCSSPLFGAGRYVEQPPSFVSQWIDDCLTDLVLWMSSDQSFMIPEANYRVFTSRMEDDGSLFNRFNGFALSHPTIRGLLNIAAVHGVFIRDFLVNPYTAPVRGLFDAEDRFVGVPFHEYWRDFPARRAVLLMSGLLSIRHPLPSLTFIKKRYGLCGGILSLFAGELYDEYKNAYASQPHLVLGRARNRAFGLALRILEEEERDRDPTPELCSVFGIQEREAARIVAVSNGILNVEEYTSRMFRDARDDWQAPWEESWREGLSMPRISV